MACNSWRQVQFYDLSLRQWWRPKIARAQAGLHGCAFAYRRSLPQAGAHGMPGSAQPPSVACCLFSSGLRCRANRCSLPRRRSTPVLYCSPRLLPLAFCKRVLRRREVQPLAEVNSGHAPQAPALQDQFIWAMWHVGVRTRLSSQPFRSHGAALCSPFQRISDTPPRNMRSHALSRRLLSVEVLRGRGVVVVVRGHVHVSRACCLYACL